MKKKTTTITVRLPTNTKEEIVRIAEKNRIKPAQQGLRLIEEALRKRA